MAKSLNKQTKKFGTMPVFMTAISTILGAILFLRFGYAIGHVGFVNTILIIVIAHLVTLPTAMAVAEIATNQKVLGGGAYYIISRSFGLKIGGAIGIALYLSQAISVAFYVIAFAEAFDPVVVYLKESWGWEIYDRRLISLPTMAILSLIMLTRGANVGMKALYFVVSILFLALALFFLGDNNISDTGFNLTAHIENPDPFFYVFTIIFPAFTGLAAGLGLSGDLRNPKKAIPRGTIWATIGGIVIYIAVAYKLVLSASAEQLANDQLIMQRIALWGPIIPIGLACAALSSALGSIMVAPRTLQAIGLDRVFPNKGINYWFAKGRSGNNEPINGSLITILIAFAFVGMGELDAVAQIISMFFMATYGAICLISLLEHFAADPSYRPTFRSRWYFSAIGAVMSLYLMFKMNLPYALASLIIMGMIYYSISYYSEERKGLANLFRGVLFQLSRWLQIATQRSDTEQDQKSWRPFAVCISKDSFKRRAAFDLLRWISFKYGFGTYIHYISGFLTKNTSRESNKVLNKLINLAHGSKNRVYLDTIISPSYTSAIAQVIQLTGISGRGNNLILFEFSRTEPDILQEIVKNYPLLQAMEFDVCILNTSYKGFGYNKHIHLWITEDDYDNANTMILLAYILIGHPEWKHAEIRIFALFPRSDLELQKLKLQNLVRSGRLPISLANIELVSSDDRRTRQEVVASKSLDADLTILGYRGDEINKTNMFVNPNLEDLGNILYVSSNKGKQIT